jgi:hypothetical protein
LLFKIGDQGLFKTLVLILDEDTPIDSPKVQLVQEQEKKKTINEWSQSLEIVMKQKFINEHQ